MPDFLVFSAAVREATDVVKSVSFLRGVQRRVPQYVRRAVSLRRPPDSTSANSRDSYLVSPEVTLT